MSKFIEFGKTPEATLQHFKFLTSKYKMMEESLQIRRMRLKAKIEEIKNSLEIVTQLAATKASTVVDYELGDTLFARATIDPSPKVHLWLGANVLLEYESKEAQDLLKKKLADNEVALEKLEHDLTFARNQITTMEVNTARLHNHVIQTQKHK